MRIDELKSSLQNINERLVLVPCPVGTDISIKQFKNANLIQGKIAWFDSKSDCNIKIYGKSYLNKEEFLEVIGLLIEFMKAPIKDREEEKKFYLRHRWLENWRDSNYLNFELSGNYYGLNDKREVFWAKTKFTLKEIEEIEEKFDTDLNDFELVEVEDEN